MASSFLTSARARERGGGREGGREGGRDGIAYLGCGPAAFVRGQQPPYQPFGRGGYTVPHRVAE